MNTHRARSSALLITLLGAVFSAGCIVDVFVDDDDDDSNVTHTNFEASRTFAETVSMDQRIRVRVTAINGSIEVRGDPDATMIDVRGERIVGSSSVSDAENHLDDLRVIITSSGDEVTVETRQPVSSQGRRYEVRYVITVPSELEAIVAQINGAIDIWGPLEDIDVDNTNGTIRALDIEDDAEIDLVNGQIEVVVVELAGDVDLTAVNGNVDITLPTDASAQLFADLVNGSIRLSGLVVMDQVTTPRSLRGTLGAGLHRVDLNTVNGDILIQGN